MHSKEMSGLTCYVPHRPRTANPGMNKPVERTLFAVVSVLGGTLFAAGCDGASASNTKGPPYSLTAVKLP